MVFLSEIFLVTFSILYGIMLNSNLGLNIFPFGKLCKSESCKPLARILVSFSIINLLPFIIFSFVLSRLEQSVLTPSFWSFLGVFLMSMIVFSPYRLFHAIIAHNPEWLYDLDNEALSCNQKKNINMVAASSITGHLIGFGSYIILAIFGGFLAGLI